MYLSLNRLPFGKAHLRGVWGGQVGSRLSQYIHPWARRLDVAELGLQRRPEGAIREIRVPSAPTVRNWVWKKIWSLMIGIENKKAACFSIISFCREKVVETWPWAPFIGN